MQSAGVQAERAYLASVARDVRLCQWLSPAAPHPIWGVDSLAVPGCEPTWDHAGYINWQQYAQGEYIGHLRAPHVTEYRYRVDDQIEFRYRRTREQANRPYRLQVGDVVSVTSIADQQIAEGQPQDLPGLLRTLENYRDQPVDFDIDLARVPGFQTRDRRTRHEVVLSKLKERLFDISRRNNLLHFRPTLQSVNLTYSSIPLTLDIRNIREDQILIWNQQLQEQLAGGQPISLNKYLNFAEALYLPSILDRIIADARRDNQEFGFAQLRLVACFLSWTNLKESPVERFVSPLVLIPVRLTKTKGIRDTYSLEALSSGT